MGCRTKEVGSFLDKIERKNYDDPKDEIKDLSGIRVITYIENQSKRVEKLIKDNFNVIDEESLDKSEELDVDRFGYRSLHYVCTVGEDRLDLEEYSVFEGMEFEIQVRTILQHAWAEIEHDRNYKFSGVLPSHLRREFYLISGLLEVADQKFNRLAERIEEYKENISDKTSRGDLDIEINSSSIVKYFEDKDIDLRKSSIFKRSEMGKLIQEMEDYGKNDIEDFDEIVSEELIDFIKDREGATYTGAVRQAMMIDNIDKYFEKSHKGKWGKMGKRSYDNLKSLYGEDKIREIISGNNLNLK